MSETFGTDGPAAANATLEEQWRAIEKQYAELMRRPVRHGSVFPRERKPHLEVRPPEERPLKPPPREEEIIQAYRELVKARGGARTVSQDIFMRETGFDCYWWGSYWPSWTAFQEAAGFKPNYRCAKIPEFYLIRRMAELALELKKIPSHADMRARRRQDPTFPCSDAYCDLTPYEVLLAKLEAYGKADPKFSPVVRLVEAVLARKVRGRPRDHHRARGLVYLERQGEKYRLGSELATGKRLRHVATRRNFMPETVHTIDTDDPQGIELYWRRRFWAKRQGRKYFLLSPEDITAFRWRRFQ